MRDLIPKNSIVSNNLDSDLNALYSWSDPIWKFYFKKNFIPNQSSSPSGPHASLFNPFSKLNLNLHFLFRKNKVKGGGGETKKKKRKWWGVVPSFNAKLLSYSHDRPTKFSTKHMPVLPPPKGIKNWETYPPDWVPVKWMGTCSISSSSSF